MKQISNLISDWIFPHEKVVRQAVAENQRCIAETRSLLRAHAAKKLIEDFEKEAGHV